MYTHAVKAHLVNFSIFLKKYFDLKIKNVIKNSCTKLKEILNIIGFATTLIYG